MATTTIEWTASIDPVMGKVTPGKTWSPIRARVRQNAAEIARAKGYASLVQIAEKMAGHVGPHCEHHSPGCDRCYSESNNARCLPANGTGLPFDRRSRDLVDIFLDEKILIQPLTWKTPVKIFAENQSDLFAEWVPDETIEKVFAVIALCPHTFQILTKDAERMYDFFADEHRWLYIEGQAQQLYQRFIETDEDPSMWLSVHGPLDNCWLGVSVETQEYAAKRIPWLLRTPAAIRFISAEPLLDEIDIYQYLGGSRNPIGPAYGGRGLDWLITGSESGKGARGCDKQWVRRLRDQCVAANVPFFYKQKVVKGRKISLPELDGRKWAEFPA